MTHDAESIRDTVRILAVDDEAAVSNALARSLRRLHRGWTVSTATSGEAALQRLDKESNDVMVADLRMPGMDGLELLRRVGRAHPKMPVIMLTGAAAVENAVEAMRLGAVDYLVKPVAPDVLAQRIQRVLHRTPPASTAGDPRLVGDSQVMRELVAEVERVARSPVNVFVRGETGTGKELIARLLHAHSTRAQGPWVAINCGAIARSLQESELFGHERGAFTGANAVHRGVFERAHTGTLFLDEIAELSLGAQVQLLRVLQEGTLRRLGSESEQSVDVRVVSATHQDLEQAVAEGRFRADLFYRLVVFPLRVPPLRERGSDVVLLLKYFMNKHAAALEMPVPALTQEGEAQLQRYAWPGNVRELENLAQRLLLRGADPIDVADLSGHGQRLEAASSPSPSPSPSPPPPAGNSLFHAERSALLQALSDAGGNVTRAAAALGIGRATMYRKIARHGIVHRS